MNFVDFLTQPTGFPLDATLLDFLQKAWRSGISAVAGLGGVNYVVLGGMEDDGINVSPGYLFVNNEVVFFEGGQKQSSYSVVEVPEQLQNQSGVFVDRKITQVARFATAGTQGQYAYSTIQRPPNLSKMVGLISDLMNMNGSDSSPWIVVSGCNKTLSNGISSGVCLYKERLIIVPAYSDNAVSETTPIYLNDVGQWVATAPVGQTGLKFEPYTDRRMEDVMYRNVHPLGSVVMQATDGFAFIWFDNTGLGKWKMKGNIFSSLLLIIDCPHI